MDALLDPLHQSLDRHWTAQQIGHAFPDDSAPSYLLHDRDQVYGEPFRRRVTGLRIKEVLADTLQYRHPG